MSLFSIYSKFIESFGRGIFSLPGEITFLSYLQIVGATTGMLLAIVVAIAIIIGGVPAPYFVYRAINKKNKNVISNYLLSRINADAEPKCTEAEYDKANKSTIRNRIIVIAASVLLYFPMYIPALFIALDLLF